MVEIDQLFDSEERRLHGDNAHDGLLVEGINQSHGLPEEFQVPLEACTGVENIGEPRDEGEHDHVRVGVLGPDEKLELLPRWVRSLIEFLEEDERPATGRASHRVKVIGEALL